MTEHVLVWHPKVPGESPAPGDDQLRLIGMPTGLVRPARQALAADQMTPAARAVLDQALAALHSHAESAGLPPTRIGFAALDEDDKATVADILGEGDVWAKVGSTSAFFAWSNPCWQAYGASRPAPRTAQRPNGSRSAPCPSRS